ncbi:MAG: PQQ-dependent sugar dehydrogenase [Chthoniobacterales bacterium]|nr:PQQ-dependent sugar dehydrogenase [Chthoniobacterales bacterium]
MTPFHPALNLRAVTALLLAACIVTSPALAQPEPTGTPSEAKGWRKVTVAEDLDQPWGITWLPDGRPLITAKEGTLHTVRDGKLEKIEMDGLPEVFSDNQGALMDIAVHPQDQDAKNARIYMTLSTGSKDENRTVLVRGTFNGERVTGIETLFRVEPAKDTSQHFGSRILFLDDGNLLMSIGDGGNPPAEIGGMLAREQAQNLNSHLGSILRLTADGKPAPGNPFADKKDALPEIWSYGHRNIQGLTRDPQSGRIWANEHGPRGGDEVNLVEAGKNYGWPEVTLGRDYRSGDEIGKDTAEGMVNPKVVWIPATAPSGLAFYTGDKFPAWRGSLFSGGLVSKDVRRIELDGEGNPVRQERITIGDRVRDVKQGPDGYLYVLTDESNGKVLRIEPEKE